MGFFLERSTKASMGLAYVSAMLLSVSPSAAMSSGEGCGGILNRSRRDLTEYFALRKAQNCLSSPMPALCSTREVLQAGFWISSKIDFTPDGQPYLYIDLDSVPRMAEILVRSSRRQLVKTLSPLMKEGYRLAYTPGLSAAISPEDGKEIAWHGVTSLKKRLVQLPNQEVVEVWEDAENKLLFFFSLHRYLGFKQAYSFLFLESPLGRDKGPVTLFDVRFYREDLRQNHHVLDLARKAFELKQLTGFLNKEFVLKDENSLAKITTELLELQWQLKALLDKAARVSPEDIQYKWTRSTQKDGQGYYRERKMLKSRFVISSWNLDIYLDEVLEEHQRDLMRDYDSGSLYTLVQKRILTLQKVFGESIRLTLLLKSKLAELESVPGTEMDERLLGQQVQSVSRILVDHLVEADSQFAEESQKSAIPSGL